MDRKLRFIGQGRHKVDGKGRVSIPAPFRRVLEAGDPDWSPGTPPQVVIVFGDHKRDYLECFTQESIDKIYEAIEKLPPRHPKRMALQRLYQTNALVTSVDDTGRLVLSPMLREKVGIDGEAFFAGIGESFEIWQPEKYEDAGKVAADDQDFDPDVDASTYLEGLF